MSRKNTKSFSKCYCQEIYSPNTQIRSINTQSTNKYSITRNNHDEKYKDSIKLQIHELAQEIRDIDDEIENKKKQYLLINHQLTARESTDESRKIKNRFSNNNISAASNVIETRVDSEEQNVDKMIEFMNPGMKTQYLEMIKKKIELQHRIKSEQSEIDVILASKMKLEKQIELLSTQILKVEAEKKEMRKNHVNDENNQDDSEIMVKKQKRENEDELTEALQKFKQFETDSEEDQFALIITDNVLMKQMHEKIAAFENKLDEIMEAHNDLENFIRENREHINLNRFKDKAVKSMKQLIDSKIAQS